MGKTNIEYTDEVSNPLMARPKGDETVKIGTFCEKPDAEGTCLSCWAEVINLRWGNGFAFDKANRDKIEWVKREKEMKRLLMRNRQKPESNRNPGRPLMVFCCDTFDLFQPSISDELREWVFDNYDQCRNLTLQIQTTYPARMSRFFRERYGTRGLPKHYWIGMSAGTQDFLDKNIEYLLTVNAAVRYVIFEPLLGPIDFGVRKDGRNPLGINALAALPDASTIWRNRIDWVIVGGESGNSPRICYLENILSIVGQCAAAGVPVLVKQLGAYAIDFNYLRFNTKHKKGGDIEEFPEELKIRQYPEVTTR